MPLAAINIWLARTPLQWQDISINEGLRKYQTPDEQNNTEYGQWQDVSDNEGLKKYQAPEARKNKEN